MRIEQLATFVCVVDERSYTRAAERLFVSQPAVYQQVRQLEQETGSKLCYVIGKDVHLTAAGRLMYDFAREVAGAHTDLLVRLRRLRSQDGHAVRIGAASFFGVTTAATEYLSATAPEIVVRFYSVPPAEAVERLRRGDLDLGFFGRMFVPDDLVAEPCAELKIVVVVPADHELAALETLTFNDVEEYPLIGFLGGSAKRAVDAWARARGGPPVRYAALADTSVSIKAMAMAMRLPALLVQGSVRDEVAAGTMKVLDVSDWDVSYMLCAVHRGRESLSPVALAYLEAVHAIAHPNGGAPAPVAAE